MRKVQKGKLAALQSKLALVPGNNKRDWDLDRPCWRRGDRDCSLERPRLQIRRVYSNLDSVRFPHRGTMIGRDGEPVLVRGDPVIQRSFARVADLKLLRRRSLAFYCFCEERSGEAKMRAR